MFLRITLYGLLSAPQSCAHSLGLHKRLNLPVTQCARLPYLLTLTVVATDIEVEIQR